MARKTPIGICVVCGGPRIRGKFYCSQQCHGASGWRLGIESSKTTKAIKNVSDSFLYWAAGFMEGEASFARTHHSPMGSEHIQVAQVNFEPLGKLQEYFGGNIALRLAKTSRESNAYLWSVHGARARGVILTLFALMSRRRQEQMVEAMTVGGISDEGNPYYERIGSAQASAA